MPNDQIRNNVPGKTFWEGIIIQKFSKPIVILFLCLSSLAASFIVAKEGFDNSVIILAALLALPVAYATVAYPKFGIATLIVVSFFINYSSRFLPEPTPIGLIVDGLTYLLIIGFFLKQKKDKIWSYFDTPISYFILIWIAYNLLEAFNPNSPSILAWLYTVRAVGFITLMYFIFIFHIRTKEFIKLLLKIWLALTLIGAISGFQQEHFGLFPFEYEWLHRFPERFDLLFISGHLRKWGIFSDPVVYSYNMAAAALLCMALVLSNIKAYKKIILGFLTAFFLLVMLYSGTRASYVIIPAAMIMLVILKFNKQMLAFVIAGGLILGIFIFIPSSNPTLIRFQSAFKPSKDASFNVRAENQERIKPYILAHPIGGGLGSVGLSGQRFAPNSYLAKFPPDSGYVRVAVEMGWIGLLLFCIFNFVVLYNGINYFYLIKDPELKSYCLAMILIIFAFDIGNYPQQAIVQYPSNILFYLAVALLNVTMRLDIEQRKLKVQATGSF